MQGELAAEHREELRLFALSEYGIMSRKETLFPPILRELVRICEMQEGGELLFESLESTQDMHW